MGVTRLSMQYMNYNRWSIIPLTNSVHCFITPLNNYISHISPPYQPFFGSHSCFKVEASWFHAFYFLLPMYYKENIVLGSCFRSGDFHGFTCLEVLDPKMIGALGLCVRDSVISITQKQIIAETLNLVYHISI